MTTDDCKALRRDLKPLADRARTIAKAGVVQGEASENVMLAFRHLEDASMRLGKAIQALDGGTSVYAKDEVPA